MKLITLLAVTLLCAASASAQMESPTLESLAGATAVSAVPVATGRNLGTRIFDGASKKHPSAPLRTAVPVAQEEEPLTPVVNSGPRHDEFGEPGEDGGGEADPIAQAIAKALKSKEVREALDGLRKEQSDKFSKEVVDNVMKDERLKKLSEGPSKTKSVIVQSGIAGAGALTAGIAFATGAATLGFLGLGILAAGLIGLLVTWIG